MDAPLERHLKVGAATVGLVGLDIELSRLLSKKDLARDDAVSDLFEAVRRQNYIPPGTEELYLKALGREYDRLVSGEERQQEEITIRILGPGCVSCNNLQTLVIEIMNELGVAADIFQVHDLDEIGRFGVLQTPALIINGELKSAGRLPSRSKIEEWLRQRKRSQGEMTK